MSLWAESVWSPRLWADDFWEGLTGFVEPTEDVQVPGGGNDRRRRTLRRNPVPVFKPVVPQPIMAVRRPEPSDEEIILSILPKLLDG